jgi:WD40 repeat protein
MMDESMLSTQGSRQSRPSERVDEACDRFESAFRAGRQPVIDDYLAEAEEADRPALWVELIALERELRQLKQAGAPPETAPPISAAAEAPTTAPETVPSLPPDGPSASVHDEATLTPSDALTQSQTTATGRLLVTETPTARIQSPFEETISPGQAAPPQSDGTSPLRIRYFGDYEITSEIARGGMGVVFRAKQMSLNRPVALKMILAGQLANEQEVRRFYTEAEAAANLDHPGIVPIFEIGEHEGQHYFSMGFVEGQSLSQRLAAGPLPARDAAALLAKVADAIEYAHQRGVIHRDLKPANILIDVNGSPRVTDFGLAKKLQSDSALTGSGQIMGTPSYMPPEQAGGQRGDVGPAADVYALGATLYALVTGRPPFQAATAMDTVLQVLSDEPVPPRRLNVSVPVDLETICLKCLQKDQGKRYVSAADLAADLRRLLADEPIVARPITRIERTVKWVRRRPAIAALLAAIASVSALGLGGVIWQWRNAVANANDAREQKDQAIFARDRARDQENRAILARDMAKQAGAALNAEKDRAVAKLYNTSIALAQQKLLIGEVARADELLDACPSHLRGWEWHYLDGLGHSDIFTVKCDSIPIVIGFPPEGRSIFSADMSGVIRLWDTESGAIVRAIRAKPSAGGAFDPKHNVLASLDSEGPRSLSLWSLKSSVPIRSLNPSAPISVAAFSPDGKTLALAVAGTDVRLWSVERDVGLEPVFKGRDGAIVAMVFSPDGRLLCVGRYNGWFEMWEVSSRHRLYEVLGHPARDAAVEKVAFSPDGKRFATASGDGTAKLWAVDGGHRVMTIWHPGYVVDVAFSPDGRLIATGGGDHMARLWDAETGQNLAVFRGHGSIVSKVAFSPDGRHLLTGAHDWLVKLWDLRSGDPTDGNGRSRSSGAKLRREPPERTISSRAAAVADLAFHPKAPRLASVGWDGVLRVDDLGTRRTVLSVTVPSLNRKSTNAGTTPRDASLGAVAYSPDGKLLAVGAGGMASEVTGVVYLIDAETSREIRATEELSGPVSAVDFSADGRRLLITTGTGNVRSMAYATPTVGVYDVATCKQVLGYKGHTSAVLAAAFSHDGSRAATAGVNGAVRIWNCSDGTDQIQLGNGRVFRGLAWSPDDKFVAAGGVLDGSVWIYQVSDGKLLSQLQRHSGTVYRVAFSPDGKRLASVGAELKLWDVASGDELLTQRDHSGDNFDVEFSPDGRRLATAGFDGKIVVRSAGDSFQAATEDWPVIFQDRFDRTELGDRWKILSGRWSIEGGAARGVLDRMPGVQYSVQAATLVPRDLYVPRSVEVSFECWAPRPIAIEAKLQNADRVDAETGLGLSFPGLLTALSPDHPASLIIAEFAGTWQAQRSNRRFTLESDVHYRLRLLREPGRVTVYAGDEEVATVRVLESDLPFLHLQGVHGSGGETVYFDNVQVRAPAAETAAGRAAPASGG